MATKRFLAYLQGNPFTVEADIVEVNGVRVVRGMEVQIPFTLPELDDPDEEYYIALPDSLLDNCYTRPTPAAPTLRDHFRSEVIDRNLSIDGHLDETPEAT